MATFSIEIPDDQLPLIGEAFTNQFIDWTPPEGYDEMSDADKIAAQTEFSRQKVIQIINETVRSWLHVRAQRAAVVDIPENPLTIS